MVDQNHFDEIHRRMSSVVGGASPLVAPEVESIITAMQSAEKAARANDPKHAESDRWVRLLVQLPIEMRATIASQTLESGLGWSGRYVATNFERVVAAEAKKYLEFEPDVVKRHSVCKNIMRAYALSEEDQTFVRLRILEDIDLLPTVEARVDAASYLAEISHYRRGISPDKSEFEPAVRKGLTHIEDIADPNLRASYALDFSRLCHPSTNQILDKAVSDAWAKHASQITNTEERRGVAQFAIWTGGHTIQRESGPQLWAETVIGDPRAGEIESVAKARAADTNDRHAWVASLELDGLKKLKEAAAAPTESAPQVIERKPKIDYKTWIATQQSKPTGPGS